MKYQFPLVIFDPECPLCLRFKQGLELMNKNISFVPLNDEFLFTTFPHLDRDACANEIHLLVNETQVIKGKDVVDYLLESTPMVSKLAWLLDNPAGDKVKSYFYDKVEELRTIVKEKQSCPSCR
jgi:predicted DCC family thiol-disulfide oxidoreductase YuxK